MESEINKVEGITFKEWNASSSEWALTNSPCNSLSKFIGQTGINLTNLVFKPVWIPRTFHALSLNEIFQFSMPEKFIITAITPLIRRRIYIRVATAVVTNYFLPIIPSEPAMTNCTREKKLFSLAIFCCFHR